MTTCSTSVADVLRFPHPVLKASHLKRGLQSVSVMGRTYVLFRDQYGKPVAMPGGCPHRGAQLAKGKLTKQRELVCPYHAWRIDGNGKVVSPSSPKLKCRVPTLRTWEKHGFIWIANPDVSDAAFPDFIHPDYELVGSFSQKYDAPLAVTLDNFGEVEHAFQVHGFIGPDEDSINTVNFSVDVQEDETHAYANCQYRRIPAVFRWFFGIRKGDLYHNRWTFRFRPLHGSFNNYWTNKLKSKRRPISFVITNFIVPANENETHVPTFVQVRIEKSWLRWLAPVIRKVAMMITRCELKWDAIVAQYAPEKAEQGKKWVLTNLDRQLMPNRQRMETIYLGQTGTMPNGKSHDLAGQSIDIRNTTVSDGTAIIRQAECSSQGLDQSSMSLP